MKKIFNRFALSMALLAMFVFGAASATYTHVLFNDGTNTWAFVSGNSSASSTMTLQRNAVTVMTIDPVNGLMVLSSTVASLPACTAALDGAVRFVTDNTGTTVGGTAAGSGTVRTLVACYGAGAVWVVG